MGTRRVRRKDGEFTLFFRKVSPFSNHHPAEFDCDGAINFEQQTRRFSCTEQYYMYNKASLMENRSLMEDVLASDNPKAMKAMCSKGAFRGWSDSVWNEHKESVMYRASLAKYRASRPLRYALFLTTDSRLVECSPFDLVWGIGKDLETVMEDETTSLESGMNLLGKILDRVREELWADEEYRDERQEVEKRLAEDQDYLLKALKHVDLMYKARATTRSLMSMGHASIDRQSYLTPELRALLPEYAIPGPIEKDEPIRASPPQIVQFSGTPTPTSRRSLTPLGSRRLSGRLSITVDTWTNSRSIRRRRRSSASTLTWERSPSRDRSRERTRRSRSRSPRRSRSGDRKRRRRSSHNSSMGSPKPKRSKHSEEKKHKKRQKRKRPAHRHRSRSRSRSRSKSRSKRSESREERRRMRKERKREKKEKKERRRQRRRTSSGCSSS